MLAVRLTAPNRLEIAQIDDPTPGPGAALIRVHVVCRPIWVMSTDSRSDPRPSCPRPLPPQQKRTPSFSPHACSLPAASSVNPAFRSI